MCWRLLDKAVEHIRHRVLPIYITPAGREAVKPHGLLATEQAFIKAMFDGDDRLRGVIFLVDTPEAGHGSLLM